MRNYPLQLIGAIASAIVGGACLGYFQDNITTSLLAIPFLSIILIFGLVGWVICVTWYGAALRFFWLRRLGIEPSLPRLGFILLWWIFTVIGGVVFFSLNEGIVSMPFFGTIAVSAGMSMAYNFFLVVLPLFIYWSVLPRNRQAKSRAKQRARRHE